MPNYEAPYSVDVYTLQTNDAIIFHNHLQDYLFGSEAKHLRYWKDKKTLLTDLVQRLQVEANKRHEALLAERKAKAEAMRVPANANTIRDAALALLCEVVYYEDKAQKASPENRIDGSAKNARSVGLAYDTIVRRVREQFPGAKTSLACLRWYCVKVRVGEHGFTGYVLPQRRPRVGQQ